MAASVEARQPEGNTFLLDAAAGLAASVLHSTAQSLEGAQPHRSEDGQLALAFDGYLANNEELRRDLVARGCILRDASDAELVLRAYEQWGDACATHLEGEFALVINDLCAGRAFCVRDHYGLRPLYYACEKDHLLVASDVATLVAALDREPEPNLEFLAQVLADDIYSTSDTVWKGIHRLPSAHGLRFSNGRVQLSRYYSLPTEVTRAYADDRDYIEEYREVFRDSVRRASEVSGGLDSSAVLAMAHRLLGEGALQASDVRAYTLAGIPDTLSDEVEYARAVTDHLGCDLYETPLFHPPLEWFDRQSAEEFDLATYPNGVQSLAMEQKMRADGVRVVLNGAGGDQWLEGSDASIEQNLQGLHLARLLRPYRAEFSSRGLGSGLAFSTRRTILALLPDRVRRMLRDIQTLPDEASSGVPCYIAPDFAMRIRAGRARLLEDAPRERIARTKFAMFESPFARFGHDLMKRQHARLGLESRSPMMSRRFIEFCASVPEDVKRRGKADRWMHRQAMVGLLPQRVVERRGKANFPVSLHHGAIAEMCQLPLPDEFFELVDTAEFTRLVERGIAKNVDAMGSVSVWTLYLVAKFLQIHA